MTMVAVKMGGFEKGAHPDVGSRRPARFAAVFPVLALLASLFVPIALGANPSDTLTPGDRMAAAPAAAAAATSAEFLSAIGSQDEKSPTIKDLYTKKEVQIPMRDGVKLFTAIYSPKDTTKKYPFLMLRTPYGVNPYGEDELRDHLGPNPILEKSGYIFIYQDVRGCYMSEGVFNNMTPHLDVKKSKSDVDESSDAYDTIDWLIKNVENHNGRVGIYGISYPGFYTAASSVDAHPAIKAISPQAPIADWFFDDFHHHGAFYLTHAFNFMSGFGRPRPEPTPTRSWGFAHGTPDGYQFFLDLGPLKNANERHFKGDLAFWTEMMDHPNYDEFWQSRNLVPHLHNMPPAVMTVGGWFDAEDLWGPLKIYRSIEAKNPRVTNSLVMGPWRHGQWGRDPGEHLGYVHFGAKTSDFYQEHMEAPFFEYYLKDEGKLDLPEAWAFETGVNEWRRFDHWPPKEAIQRRLYMREKMGLSFEAPNNKETGDSAAAATAATTYDEYISDPAKPVPYTEDIAIGMTREHMIDDQRFAARRPDVLAYQTPVLEENLTLVGPIYADLWVSTSGSDSDWIVKVIDVFPPDFPNYEDTPPRMKMGGYQMMVRNEVLRGRFRDSYEKPSPFEPNKPAHVRLELQDVLHTFRKGHRVMVQIQSTWFPLVDRNPQKYVENPYYAGEEDFIKATQRVYRTATLPSAIEVLVLPQKPAEPPPPKESENAAKGS